MEKYLDYEIYLEEYLVEADKEKDTAVEEYFVESYYLRDNLLIPYIRPVLQKRANRDKIIEFTGTFINDNNSKLYTAGPVYIISFAEKETDFLYGLFGLSKEKILEMFEQVIQKAYRGNLSSFLAGLVKSCPHKLLITGIYIDALQNGYDDIIECAEYLMGFAEYPLLYRKSWPKFDVDKDIMAYTIEHLKSSRFKVKRFSNLLELLKYDAWKAMVFYREQLKTAPMDHIWVNLIYRLRNGMKSTFKNIANEYYPNHEKGATIHTRDSIRDDKTLVDQEGHATNISAIVENTYNKFLSSGINSSIAAAVAEHTKVNKSNLISHITKIITTKNNGLHKFIENVVTIYFQKNPTSTTVRSKEFINFGLILYRSIGNSKDPTYQSIKKILDMWGNDIIELRTLYSSSGTISNYVRAIFNYMIWMINHHN